jgi:hypothetical protein
LSTKINLSGQELRVLVYPSAIDLSSSALRFLSRHLAERRGAIGCRCSHQWMEWEITRGDFDAMLVGPATTCPTLTAAIRASGYDGTLAGVYLSGPGAER